ncbi:MAG: sensor histidine kinase [bacterium]|jgi:two-component system sensor histidine kinase ArlS
MSKGKSATISDKIRSSLVLKLNMRLMGRLVSGFVSINILILLMSLSVTLWKAEEGAQVIIDMINLGHDNLPAVSRIDKDYQVLVTERPPKGLVLPAEVQKHLPVQISDVKRIISMPRGQKETRFWDRIGGATYNMAFLVQDTAYKIVYDLGTDLQRLLYLAAIVLFFELLIVIKNMNKGSRVIRKTLRPLSEMAEKARQINDDLYYGRSLTGPQIKNLAGVISDIDASRLDRRISVDEAQNELKDLAAAINGMLNRISAAYESQLRFVSDASHELRTPISVIQGYANLLDRWGKKDEKTLQESIDAIKSETESMKDLVEQLLFLARGDNETLKLHKQDFDCSDVIDEIATEARMIHPDHNFELNLVRPADIKADKQLFKQAIRILVDNSIKYSPSGEKIIIRVITEKGSIRISVQDNGIGIAPEELPNIFDRFYRSDESRARKTGGSGLGLAIAKWIVERHGGHVEVLSRLGIGTRITVVLPR